LAANKNKCGENGCPTMAGNVRGGSGNGHEKGDDGAEADPPGKTRQVRNLGIKLSAEKK
jgi:hypothetical protein